MTLDTEQRVVSSTSLGVFDRADFADDAPHEQVVFCHDQAT